ncbi:ketoacyl-ACP synthase III family protein [Actinokineospora sp.]|uniref:ketoacyl-ACP synthase III family protein n=1 Tax=Actinokineospora sp. TaxID=1872133 RepID=UPI00403847A5
MRCTKEIFVAGTAAALPKRVTVTEAEAAGLVDEMHTGLGYDAITVADGVAGPQMAIEAGRAAIARSGIAASEYELMLHSSLWFQGLDMWGTASYVANETVGAQALSMDLQQRSCGAMAAFHLATAYLQAGFGSTALITTGDNFAAPAFDRWNSQMYTLFGDAGTALALSTRGGFAKVLATAAFADNSLEGFGRGAEPFRFAPGTEAPVPVLRRLAQHMTTPAAAGGWERIEAAMLKTRDQVLGDAGVDLSDIRRAVLPFIHRGGGQDENFHALGFTEEQSLWEFGRTVGHLGAGDQFAGLNHLLETGALAAGDRVLVFGVGVGFNFVATVLEMLTPPGW